VMFKHPNFSYKKKPSVLGRPFIFIIYKYHSLWVTIVTNNDRNYMYLSCFHY
jgi:hypothetical protein